MVRKDVYIRYPTLKFRMCHKWETLVCGLWRVGIRQSEEGYSLLLCEWKWMCTLHSSPLLVDYSPQAWLPRRRQVVTNWVTNSCVFYLLHVWFYIKCVCVCVCMLAWVIEWKNKHTSTPPELTTLMHAYLTKIIIDFANQ